MNCPACGTEVEKNAVYCPKCGERVDMQEELLAAGGEPQAPQPEAAPPQAAPPETAPAPAPTPPKTPAEAMRESLQDRKEAAEDEEQQLWEGRYSRRTMVGAWLLCALVTVAALVIGALWIRSGILWGILLVVLLVMWGYPVTVLAYRRMSIRYRLTTQRFFHEKGILRHVTDRIEVIDIDDIAYDQTILQRLVNVGTIHITSSDRSHPVLDILGIENVREVASLMDGARRKERIRRGLHIEAV